MILLKTKPLLLLSALLLTMMVKAQGLAVNTTGNPADPSAVLDVSSGAKGMLIPRMPSSQRTSISNPATGLLVYQTDAPAGFYQYNGTMWLSILSDSVLAGGDLKGKYPNPSIAATDSAGTHIVSAINASAGVVNPANLGTGTASSSTYLRGDGTWNTPATKYFIPMGSGSSWVGLTINTSGFPDTVVLVGIGAASNQLVNINGGFYIDASGTFPMVEVPLPVFGTISSFSFFFRITNTAILFLSAAPTLQAQLYYSAPPAYTLIGAEQFYPVPGATVNFNLMNLTSGIGVQGETLTANISGLSYALPAGSRLFIMLSYNYGGTPNSLTPLTGNVTAAVGMQ